MSSEVAMQGIAVETEAGMTTGAQASGVSTSTSPLPSSGSGIALKPSRRELLRPDGVSGKLARRSRIPHRKFDTLLKEINRSHTSRNLNDGLARLGVGASEAGKLMDISASRFNEATANLTGLTFFCSARHPRLFEEYDRQVAALLRLCEEDIDFVVTGYGPGMMSIPVVHAKSLEIPTIGVPADIPAEHARVGPEAEPDVILDMLHLPTRKEVFMAMTDVYVVLGSGLGGLDEVSEVLLRGQLQRTFGAQVKYPYLKRAVPPQMILVGKIWAALWDSVLGEMEDEGTVRKDEVPFVHLIREPGDLAERGAQIIREHAQTLARSRPAAALVHA